MKPLDVEPQDYNGMNSTSPASQIVSFLASHDVGCPSCGYNMRDCTTSTCPECGQELTQSRL